jgi:pathogenesis-related protein 1
MRYLLILSVLVLAAPAVMSGNFSGMFSAYACDGCTDDPEPENLWVQKHNEARSAVGVSDIVWDESLAVVAKKHADELARKCGGLYHSRSEYGENIASSWGHNPNYNAVDAWVREKQWYDYRTNTCQKGKVCGHYTQVIWRSTNYLGCAVSSCKKNGTKKKYRVCSYKPSGNWVGERPY